MYRVQSLTQAYAQAPWRKQLQWIGLFLLGLILVAMTAGIYLSVSARTATVGREIQGMFLTMDDVERSIENRETQLAVLLSNSEMEKRAEALGFRPATAEETFYVQIPGYVRPEQASLASLPGHSVPDVPSISEEYTQSLLDWLRKSVFEPAAPLIQEVKP
jgi:hypothetical protein